MNIKSVRVSFLCTINHHFNCTSILCKYFIFITYQKVVQFDVTKCPFAVLTGWCNCCCLMYPLLYFCILTPPSPTSRLLCYLCSPACVLYLLIFFSLQARGIHYHMSSFNENAGLSLIKHSCLDFVEYPFMLHDFVVWFFLTSCTQKRN